MDIFMLLSCEELVKIMAGRFYLTVTSAWPPIEEEPCPIRTC
jgi:hypothetical protein